MNTHDYGTDGFCTKCGFSEWDAKVFPWMSCEDVIEDHELEMEFEEYTS